MGKAMGGYVRDAFFSGVIVGVLTYIGLRLIGVPFPLVLAVIAGLMEIIPILGPMIPGVLVTADVKTPEPSAVTAFAYHPPDDPRLAEVPESVVYTLR